MSVLTLILKATVVTVLLASLAEALVLSWLRGKGGYDWKAAAISLTDFLVREYPLRWLLPLLFWVHAMQIEFGQWQALWRDLRGARSLREAWNYLWKPPGWSPRGPGETTEALRRRAAAA